MDFESEFSSLARKVAFARMRAERSGCEVRIKITPEFEHQLTYNMLCRLPSDIKCRKFMGCDVEIADKMEVTIVEIVK